jgi:hypothetical protein
VRDRFGAGRVTAGNGSGARSPAMLSAYPATVDPLGCGELDADQTSRLRVPYRGQTLRPDQPDRHVAEQGQLDQGRTRPFEVGELQLPGQPRQQR